MGNQGGGLCWVGNTYPRTSLCFVDRVLRLGKLAFHLVLDLGPHRLRGSAFLQKRIRHDFLGVVHLLFRQGRDFPGNRARRLLRRRNCCDCYTKSG